jgi:hypothetical protein
MIRLMTPRSSTIRPYVAASISFAGITRTGATGAPALAELDRRPTRGSAPAASGSFVAVAEAGKPLARAGLAAGKELEVELAPPAAAEPL